MPEKPRALSDAARFAAVSEELGALTDQKDTLDRVAELVFDVVPNATYCDAMLRRAGRWESMVATDDLVVRCGALQLELEEGPLWESPHDPGAFLVTDTAHEERWPRWCAQLAELGIRSVVAVQLRSYRDDGDRVMGLISVYDKAAGTFSQDDVDRALVFATHVATALTTAKLVGRLETSIKTRHLIGVAQGILMQRHNLTEADAYAAIRRYAGEHRLSVGAAAEVVVGGESDPMIGLQTGSGASAVP
ncbi:GAF and ANTAR domain-containing protein [Nocardioides sp. Bht2]|uniref:GAF and ANTAR domain-containing protein n=1 Tax=Nocardioides sp. Bht2 TaxID=3392297 RepID=UPI0039B3B3AE